MADSKPFQPYYRIYVAALVGLFVAFVVGSALPGSVGVIAGRVCGAALVGAIFAGLVLRLSGIRTDA